MKQLYVFSSVNYREILQFVNVNKIPQSDIQSILLYDHSFCCFYWASEDFEDKYLEDKYRNRL